MKKFFNFKNIDWDSITALFLSGLAIDFCIWVLVYNLMIKIF